MSTSHSRIFNRALTRLKLKQLQLLVAVGRHKSILHAARELGLSQPAATKMIQELEIMSCSGKWRIGWDKSTDPASNP